MNNQYGKGLVQTVHDEVQLVIRNSADYKGKTSRHTIREQHERDSVLQRRMVAEGSKAEMMCIVYGGTPNTEDGKLLVAGMKAGFQRELQAHTSAGDFTHLAANPLILK